MIVCVCVSRRHLKNSYFIDRNAYAFDKRQLKVACSMWHVCGHAAAKQKLKAVTVSVSEMVAGYAGKPVGCCSMLGQARLVGCVALNDWLVDWLQRLTTKTFGCSQLLTSRCQFHSTYHFTPVCISLTERVTVQPLHVWLESRRNQRMDLVSQRVVQVVASIKTVLTHLKQKIKKDFTDISRKQQKNIFTRLLSVLLSFYLSECVSF